MSETTKYQTALDELAAAGWTVQRRGDSPWAFVLVDGVRVAVVHANSKAYVAYDVPVARAADFAAATGGKARKHGATSKTTLVDVRAEAFTLASFQARLALASGQEYDAAAKERAKQAKNAKRRAARDAKVRADLERLIAHPNTGEHERANAQARLDALNAKYATAQAA